MRISCFAASLAMNGAAISNANADRLVIKGSDTLGAKQVPQLAEEFSFAYGKISACCFNHKRHSARVSPCSTLHN